MKSFLRILSMVALGAVALGTSVQAAPLNQISAGSSFNIAGVSHCTVSNCTFPGLSLVGVTSGDFLTAGFIPGIPVSMNSLTFDPFTPGQAYTSSTLFATTSFDLTSQITRSVSTVGPLFIGTIVDGGVARLTGYLPTPGLLTLTFNELGDLNGTFSATAGAVPVVTNVPEPDFLAIFGLGLAGLGFLRHTGKQPTA